MIQLYKALLKSGIFVLLIIFLFSGQGETKDEIKSENIIELPKARVDSKTSIESSLLQRRSIRRYADQPLSLDDVSQLLWAAQGITHARGFRTSPSAGALYPLEVYVVVGNVLKLPSGIYKYDPNGHNLITVVEGDKRMELSRAALGQGSVKRAPVVMVFTAVYRRTTSKYGGRGVRYVFMEIGHAAQNVCLQAVSLGLATVTIGAFQDEKVKEIIHCRPNEEPLYIMPVGKQKKG